MASFTRKEFLAVSGQGVAAAALALHARGAGADPSDRILHAIIGCGGQGGNHAKQFSSLEGCEVAAVCDVDPERRAKLAKALPNTESVRVEEDFRRILDDASIDSVSITTPDHWHTPIALHALLAGKHVYVEKPCSHTVREGNLLGAAAKKHARQCVQHGTQSRGTASLQQGMAFMRDGGIGKVRLAKAINHQLREPIGRAEESAPPEGANYDLWLGPAPMRPFTRNRWHYNWHWHWEYGGGDMVNDGIHQVDVARWGLGAGLPKAISASGGQLFYDDDHETPDTQVVTFEYDEYYLLYEMRLWTDYPLEGHNNGVIFYGDNGTMHIGRRGAEVFLKDGSTQLFEGGPDIRAHMQNFLDCVREGTPEKLAAPIAECNLSATLCNLGNIATRVGRRLHYDAAAGICTGDEEATALLDKQYRAGYELPEVG